MMSGSTEGLSALTTEQVNPACAHIDEMGTLEALRTINEQDRTVADAVSLVLPQLAVLVDGTVGTFSVARKGLHRRHRDGKQGLQCRHRHPDDAG